jgi:hypothetical protein
MLIFAHYGVLYSRIHDIWWAHDFGYHLIWDLATFLQASKSLTIDHQWRRTLHSLYAGSLLIWIRCVFRLIEYAQGNDGYVISHEAFLYIFDAALMFGVMVLFALVHPSEITAQLRGPGAKKVERGVFTYAMV